MNIYTNRQFLPKTLSLKNKGLGLRRWLAATNGRFVQTLGFQNPKLKASVSLASFLLAFIMLEFLNKASH